MGLVLQETLIIPPLF